MSNQWEGFITVHVLNMILRFNVNAVLYAIEHKRVIVILIKIKLNAGLSALECHGESLILRFVVPLFHSKSLLQIHPFVLVFIPLPFRNLKRCLLYILF